MSENQAEEKESDVDNGAQSLDHAPNAENDDSLGDGGKKALDSERAARRAAEKQIKDLASKVEKFEDSQRTEDERRQHELEKARAEVEEAHKAREVLERKLLVSEIAARKGIPPQMASRLQGATAEEIEVDADEMKKLLAPEGPRVPRPVHEEGRVTEGARSEGQIFEDFFKANF